MIRVFDFRMEGSDETIKLASMSHSIAKRFIEDGQELLKDENTPIEKWQERQSKTILESLKRAGAHQDYQETLLVDAYDIPTLNAMFTFILEKSGLKTGETKSGEAKAA